MIKNEGKDIICSYGDTFICSWYLNTPEIKEEDEILFSIKNTPESTNIIKQVTCENAGQHITAKISATEFASTLPIGNYVYDLVIKSNNEKLTLLFPSNFIVKAVVHDD